MEETGGYAYESCTSLQRIIIPNAVNVIKEDAFKHCYELTTVTLCDDVKAIGGYAFHGCSLTHIVIPPAVKAIQEGSFSSCSELTTGTFGDGVEEIRGN